MNESETGDYVNRAAAKSFPKHQGVKVYSGRRTL